MKVYVESHRGDGTTIVVDPDDGARFVVQTLTWAKLAMLPRAIQRGWLNALGGQCWTGG